MDVAYGIQVLPENDPYIRTAEEAIMSVAMASMPGTFLVNVFPILKYVPAWVPGAGFQRKAKAWKKLARDMVQAPYATFKKDMVSRCVQRYF